MRGLSIMVEDKSTEIYVMYNATTDVTIQCTKRYLLAWIARGFEVLEIRDGSFNEEIGSLSVDDDTPRV